MSVSRHPSAASLSIDARVLRAMVALMLAGILLSVVATLSDAEALGPTVDTGGSGSSQLSVADMLRGAYSPIGAEPEIAITEVQSTMTVSDMLRGAYSPIDGAPEIAVTEVQAPMTVADMLRGDLSPV